MTKLVKSRKGIILAGGRGSRLFPITQSVCKQLLPVFDKPMIYYPICTLMLAGIREILIITTPEDQKSFQSLLGSGAQFGINFSFCEQAKPNGLAEALILAEGFLNGHPSCLILGDNLFHGHQLSSILEDASSGDEGATVFGYRVADPHAYGVVEFDKNGNVIEIVEKPDNPKSNFAVTGLYFFDHTAPERASKLKPSARGELEITDLNNSYLRQNKLKVRILNRGVAWFDTGTPENLLEASSYVHALQSRQGLFVSSPEEIAFRKSFISAGEVITSIKQNGSNYYTLLQSVLESGS